MVKVWLLLIVLFELVPIGDLGQNDLDYFRTAFYQIETEKEFEEYLTKEIEVEEEFNRNTIMAYKGACQSMMARFVVSPFTKMKHFNEGKSLLEGSIAHEHNVDNVYLRLLVQLNAPGMLGYDEDIDSDLIFLQEHVKKSNLSLEVKEKMMDKLMSSKNANDYMEALKKIGV